MDGLIHFLGVHSFRQAISSPNRFVGKALELGVCVLLQSFQEATVTSCHYNSVKNAFSHMGQSTNHSARLGVYWLNDNRDGFHGMFSADFHEVVAKYGAW